MTSHQSMVQARDNAYKYASRHPDDPHMLNLLGLLYEQEGLNVPAQQSFARYINDNYSNMYGTYGLCRAAAMLGSSGRELGIVSANKARMLR